MTKLEAALLKLSDSKLNSLLILVLRVDKRGESLFGLVVIDHLLSLRSHLDVLVGYDARALGNADNELVAIELTLGKLDLVVHMKKDF